MIDLAPILPKIDKLVRMLASDNDGEALNAVRRLGQMLYGAGASFHDLADRIVQEPVAAVGYGDEYWQPPKPKRGNNDFVEPKRQRPPPRPAGPPLWEALGKVGRLTWLGCVLRSDKMSIDQKSVAAVLRAQAYSQPHVQLKPAQCTGINTIFADAWLKDMRPVADLLPGDPRQPLIWTGKNRAQVRRVLTTALQFIEHKDAQFAQSVVARIDSAPSAFSTPSTEEVERIDRVLVLAYDLGARP